MIAAEPVNAYDFEAHSRLNALERRVRKLERDLSARAINTSANKGKKKSRLANKRKKK